MAGLGLKSPSEQREYLSYLAQINLSLAKLQSFFVIVDPIQAPPPTLRSVPLPTVAAHAATTG